MNLWHEYIVIWSIKHRLLGAFVKVAKSEY